MIEKYGTAAARHIRGEKESKERGRVKKKKEEDKSNAISGG